jgi:hypothetical protein
MLTRITALLPAILFATASLARDGSVDAGPYVASSDSAVVAMLPEAEFGADDYLIDLATRDGRPVRTAANVLGARGIGVELVALSLRVLGDALSLRLAGRKRRDVPRQGCRQHDRRHRRSARRARALAGAAGRSGGSGWLSGFRCAGAARQPTTGPGRRS